MPDHRPRLPADRVLDLLDRPDPDPLQHHRPPVVLERHSRKTSSDALPAAVATARSRPGAACRAQHPKL